MSEFLGAEMGTRVWRKVPILRRQGLAGSEEEAQPRPDLQSLRMADRETNGLSFLRCDDLTFPGATRCPQSSDNSGHRHDLASTFVVQDTALNGAG
jgi:hypothetical protein